MKNYEIVEKICKYCGFDRMYFRWLPGYKNYKYECMNCARLYELCEPKDTMEDLKKYKFIDELNKNNVEYSIECSNDENTPDKLYIKDYEFIWDGKKWFNLTEYQMNENMKLLMELYSV
jgi:hypothetical protein